MIANESGKAVANAPPKTLASTGERTVGVPRDSSGSSSSEINTGTVKRRPTSLEAKEKTPSPTGADSRRIEQSNTKESLLQDEKHQEKAKHLVPWQGSHSENDSVALKEGSKKSPDHPTISPEAIKSSTAAGSVGNSAHAQQTTIDRRKTLTETKIPATKTTRLDERLKSKLKPPSVLQRASNFTSSKGDTKSSPGMKSSSTTTTGAVGGGQKEKKVSSPPSSASESTASSVRSQKKVSFIPNLSMSSATVSTPGGNIRTSAVKTILRTRAQQQSQQQQHGDSTVEYKELYRDYPLPLPPYREPPPAPPVSTNVGTIGKQRSEPKQMHEEQQQFVPEPTKNEDVSTVVRSKLKGFGLGKLISSHSGQERRNTNNYVTLPPSPKATAKTMSSKGGACVGGDLPAIPQASPMTLPTASGGGQEKPRQPSPDDILSKPEFSSSLFKNIPVRQKKGTVPHLENYCLFDPSVDFFNEKEHKMRAIPETVELADQVLYQDHLIYDAVVDRDSDNYFTIEPESLEIEVKNRLSLEKVEEKIDEIFNQTRTASSSSTSSTSGSSPDYPSMFNSVIETPSSNLESTDESDYGFRNRLMENLKVLVVPKSISGSIPDENAEVEDIPNEEAELEDIATNDPKKSPSSSSVYYGVVLKSGPVTSRLERVHQQQSVSLPNSPLIQHRLQQQSLKQHRKCDESSSSSSSATVSPPAALHSASSEGTTTTATAGGTLLRQNTFTCSSSALVTPVGESITTSTAQAQGTPKAINTLPAASSSITEQDKMSAQKMAKMKSVTSVIAGSVSGTGGTGKVANFLPLLRSTFALDPLKSSFSLPQLPTGVSGANGGGRVSSCGNTGTGAISKVQSTVAASTQQPRNGSLDSTPLFNRLRKRERPLSNHSDADSGFLSPATPPDSNGASILAACDEVIDQAAQGVGTAQTTSDAVVLEQCDSIQELIQIYTDWANYYLERAKSKRKVSDLSADCRDGLLLAEVIEAVTTFKVPDLVKKPKTPQHMYDNVNSCLTVLKLHQVGGLESVTPNDICSGRLKAVLSLFFALSRYKQATKQKSSLQLQPPQLQQQQQQQQQLPQQHQTKVEIHAVPAEMTNRQLPVPYAKAGVNGGTAIPLPATVLVTRRCPPDKVRPLPPTPNQQTGLHGGLQKHTLGAGGINNSTPSDGNSCPGSPQHHNGTAIITQIPKGNNSLRLPQATNCKIPASPYSASNTLQHNNHHNNNNNTITLIPNGNVTNIPTNPAQQQQQHQKHSMLDKFKLFNSKEKQDRAAQKSQISKRTSSSSGFSSARSERSDSSLSLDNGHHQGTLQPTVVPTSAIPGAKIKESGLKKLDSSAKSSPSPAMSASTKSSSKLISSKSSSKESSKAAAKAAAAAEKQRHKDPGGVQDSPQTHIPLAPQKAQKIPMATTVTTTSLATAAVGASAMASTKVQAQDSSRLKLASVGSAGRKLDAKSESKTSLLQSQMLVPQSPKTMVPPQQMQHQQQQQQQMQQSAVGTGIPKPMAAIKGTSKPPQLLTPTGGSGKEELTVCKPIVGAIVQPQVPNNNNANGAISLSGNNNTMMGQLLQQQQQQQQLIANGASNGGGMSDSMHSNSTQGASMGQHSTNSSETSSVVAYRPSSESGSEHLLQSPQKLHPSNGAAGPLLYGGQPDVNLNSSNNGSSSPGAGHVFHNGNGNLHHSNNNHSNSNTANNNNNLNKFHTVPTKMLNTGSPLGANQTTIYEQEEKQITVLPMRPLLRGYNSHVTLPTRGTRGHHPHHPHVHHHQLMTADYCEDFNGQGGGYCSDGDALRKIPARYSDNIDNGYLSEGGGSASILTSAGRQQHASYISSLRARTQLPTTIEERCRSSRGDHLDSVGTNPPAMEHSHVNGKSSARHSSGSSIGPNGREYWGKLPEPSPIGHGSNGGTNSQHSSQPPSPTASRKDKTGSSPGQSRRSAPSSKGGSSRTKAAGVPQSFGYIKRTNGGGGSSMPGIDPHQQQQQQQQGQNLLTGGRTAHVSAVPRSSKLKVSGGTQTTTADFQAKVQQHPQYRSFSLTGPGAAQLSQSVKERMSNRASAKLTDGSLSDTQTYAEVKPDYGSYAMWLKHSNTASSRLSEGDTLDAISLGTAPSAAVAAVTGSPGSVTRPHKLLHHTRGETQQPHLHQQSATTNSPRLNRSNSISYLKERTYPRSTKSEKMYPSMLSRGPDVEIEPYYCLPVGTVVHAANGGMVPWSQPTSPTPPARGFGGLLSPTHTGSGGGSRLTYPKKNDEVHGSQASLLSGGSSLYGSTEERQAGEVRRLKRELTDARDQVMSLSSQLSTNVSICPLVALN
ncbi:uncharacterized protein LOC125763349 isoform X3 [Anopheles funestus]|uniref:uncharacterized protein LOC125763349 isoform X3 n=1 Tax=Anopheles funestus TaxID=62324 RepID=UPI0020C74602|nr:uncharacterized protein LOC125763349 isoform X3 [Anopheles funestus]